ncbi:MAG: VOC family protein [Chloroflexi bacterium]|nr:VOC family protein [Chloroflexota bacterium]
MPYKYRGLDHVVVRVKDIEAASRDYEKVLGIPGVNVGELDPSGGFRNALFPMGSSGMLIELCQGLDATKQAGGAFIRAIERRGEGLHNVALAVDDIEGAFADFERRGTAIIPNARFRNFFLHPRVTHGVLFQILQPQRRIKSPSKGDVSYVRLHHVDIAVRDIVQAARDYESVLGVNPAIPIKDNKALGILEVFFIADGSGAVLGLYQPADTTRQAGAAFARFLEQHGEGVQCVALEVESVEQAHERAKGLNLPIVLSQHSRSFFLHPRATHGVLYQVMQAR